MKNFEYKGETRTVINRQLVFPNQKVAISNTDAHIDSLIAQGLLVSLEEEDPTDFESMKKADLIAYALQLNIAVNNSMKKEEIITLLKNNK